MLDSRSPRPRQVALPTAFSRDDLPADAFDGFADAEAVAELLELPTMTGIGTVQVLAFCDEFELVVADDAIAAKDLGERTNVGGVHDEEFVLVELHFHRTAGRHHRKSGATIVYDEIFEITALAFEDWQIDRFAEQIDVPGTFGFVARFEDDIDDIAKGIEQIEKGVEEFVSRERGSQNWNLKAGFFIAIGFDAKSFARRDASFLSRTNRVGELEIAVAVNQQMFEHGFCAHGHRIAWEVGGTQANFR